MRNSNAPFSTRWEAGEAATVVDSLTTMSAWSSLRQLRLEDPWPQLPAPVWQVLGTFSQLTSLVIDLQQAPADDDGLQLMGCKALQSLWVYAEAWSLALRSTVRFEA